MSLLFLINLFNEIKQFHKHLLAVIPTKETIVSYIYEKTIMSYVYKIKQLLADILTKKQLSVIFTESNNNQIYLQR